MRLLTALIMILLAAVPAVAQQDDGPAEVDFALQHLSERLGRSVTLADINSWTWQGRVFNDASLGCPQPGEAYAQVQTEGYRFVVEYQGINYDYRVAENDSNVVLCSMEPTSQQPEAPASPSQCPATYIIAPGDTLYSIARRCDITVDALMTANPAIENAAFIIVGQEITIPDGSAAPGQFAIAPTSGPTGTEVQLTAEGFDPNTQIDVGFGPVESEYDVIDTVTSGVNGSVNTTVSVPSYADSELEWVFVLAAPGGNPRLISDVFDVTAGTSPVTTPTPALFTRTDIYLVALEDAGQTGEEIGCGDSLVPVEVTFQPTVAPLTAALEELFAINTEFYGQSGLYSALYQSDLSVDSIDIDENRHATINLSGDLLVGGVCDEPRVEAQIEQTALQYDTIDTVSVTLNGDPLAESLR